MVAFVQRALIDHLLCASQQSRHEGATINNKVLALEHGDRKNVQVEKLHLIQSGWSMEE